MTNQEQKVRSKDKQKPTSAQESQTDTPGAEARERAAKVSAETDELLDDIDALLNELPEDLATEFRQSNGE